MEVFQSDFDTHNLTDHGIEIFMVLVCCISVVVSHVIYAHLFLCHTAMLCVAVNFLVSVEDLWIFIGYSRINICSATVPLLVRLAILSTDSRLFLIWSFCLMAAACSYVYSGNDPFLLP